MNKKLILLLSGIVLVILSIGVYQFYLAKKKLDFTEVVPVSQENLHSIIIATSGTNELVSLNRYDHDKQLKAIRELMAEMELKRYHPKVSHELYIIGFQTRTAVHEREVIVYEDVIEIRNKNKKPIYYQVLNKEPLIKIIDILLSENE